MRCWPASGVRPGSWWPPSPGRPTWPWPGTPCAPLGGHVVAVADQPTLPFAAGSFDLVVSRHPVVTLWDEIARVLRPGGTYLSQQIGPGTNRELTEFFLGPMPVNEQRRPERAADAARAAGLDVVDSAARCGSSSSTWPPSCTSCARCLDGAGLHARGLRPELDACTRTSRSTGRSSRPRSGSSLRRRPPDRRRARPIRRHHRRSARRWAPRGRRLVPVGSGPGQLAWLTVLML